MSKSPPIDSSLRPGPISRWQHPLIPATEPSAIKAAVLSQPASQLPANNRRARRTLIGTQLPPAENLRQRAANLLRATRKFESLGRSGPNHQVHADLLWPNPTPSARCTRWARSQLDFQPPILPCGRCPAQSKREFASDRHNLVLSNSDSRSASNISAAFSIDHARPRLRACLASRGIDSRVPIRNARPRSWLKQAQDAATHAKLPEELATVVELLRSRTARQPQPTKTLVVSTTIERVGPQPPRRDFGRRTAIRRRNPRFSSRNLHGSEMLARDPQSGSNVGATQPIWRRAPRFQSRDRVEPRLGGCVSQPRRAARRARHEWKKQSPTTIRRSLRCRKIRRCFAPSSRVSTSRRLCQCHRGYKPRYRTRAP